MAQERDNVESPEGIEKCPTGIRGLDDILEGGLPRGRPTLVAGGAGSGKTLLAMEFLVRGATQYGEPGVFMAFEETAEELTKLIDMLKSERVTAMLTYLSQGGEVLEETEMGISSLIDAWTLLRDIEIGGERNRVIYILKSRGMAHSNQIREFRLTDKGIDIIDVYTGPAGVLTGTARVAQEAKEKAAEVERREDIERRKRELERQRKAAEAQIEAIRAEVELREEEVNKLVQEEEIRRNVQTESQEEMARMRELTLRKRSERRPTGDDSKWKVKPHRKYPKNQERCTSCGCTLRDRRPSL